MIPAVMNKLALDYVEGDVCKGCLFLHVYEEPTGGSRCTQGDRPGEVMDCPLVVAYLQWKLTCEDVTA